MDKFPRDKQNELLLALYENFPNYISDEQYSYFVDVFGGEDNLCVNLWYLHNHGLIDKAVYFSADGLMSINLGGLKITRNGIDFIRDDGGLSAILNVMTIKIHNETIEKLSEIINKSDLTTAEKTSFVGKLKELPADAIKHLVFELLSKGLSHVPDVIQIVSSYIR